MNARQEWLAERKHGLGGSDIGAILGLSKYRTPVDVWAEKTGRIAGQDETLQMRFGSYAEDFVAREYSARTGNAVQRFTTMLHHPTAPILGNVDRLVIPAGQKRAAHQREIRTDLGLECKTASAFAALDENEWGDEGTDQVPASYLIQCVTYMALTGCSRWDLSVLFGNQELRIYNLARDLELEGEVIARSAEWWQAHVVADVAPEPVNDSDVALLYPQAKQKEEIAADGEIILAVDMLRSTKEQLSTLEKYEGELALQIKRFMGHADTLLGPDGKKLATWGNRKGRTTFDLDTFVGHLCPGANPAERALFIEDAKRTFTTRGEPGRTFTLK